MQAVRVFNVVMALLLVTSLYPISRGHGVKASVRELTHFAGTAPR